MRVLNLLSAGGIGGIEILCKDIAEYSKYENAFCFLFERGSVYEEIKAKGNMCYDLSDLGKGFSLRKLRQLITISLEYDIVVSHHGSIGLHTYFYLLQIFNKKSKYVLTCHSCFEESTYYYHNPIKTLMRKYILHSIIEKSDRVVFVSEAGKRTFCDEFSIDDAKTRVVYNGINPRMIEDGKENEIVFDGQLKILYVGRLAQVKGVHLLIDALHNLMITVPATLTIVGDGIEKDKLVKQVQEYSMNHVVSFEGSKRNVSDYYKIANVFVYPSTWQEVFGISIVEAMAYGIPCIANSVGGIPEIIRNGENGFITESTDSIGIEKALEMIYNNYRNNNYKQMSLNCKATSQYFCIQKTVEKLKEIYSELLENGT